MNKAALLGVSFVWLVAMSAAKAQTESKTVATQGAPPRMLTFGIYQFNKPTEVLKQIQPALDTLERSLGRELGESVRVQMQLTATYQEGLDRLANGTVDLVRFGPASYVTARRRSPGIELLAAEQEDGAMVCRGVIVVRADSDIRSLADLRGRRFAFGDDQSTIGRYLSQSLLVDAGITARDLAGFEYLHRHDKVYGAVALGDFDAGALHEQIFEDRNKKTNALRPLVAFDNVGKPWIARAGLEPRLVAALRRTLLGLKEPKALKALAVSGFMVAKDADYDFVRAAMAKAEQFQAAPPDPAPAVK
jgi:phosphonate transport system substrate-binding protein